MFFRNRFARFLQSFFHLLILSGISSFLFVLPSYANFSLDPTFGSGGIVITSFGNQSVTFDEAFQTDGKAVVVGNNHNGGHKNWAIVRFKTDGSLDTSFGTNGIITQDFTQDNVAHGVAVQPSDGKIVVGGADTASNGNGVGWTVARYNGTNGSLDTSFGTNGIVTTPIYQGQLLDLALQQDGKIVTVGYDGATNASPNHFVVVRYNPDGTLDGTFGSGGIVAALAGSSTLDRARSVVIQQDGKIVIFGDLTLGGSGYIFTTRLNSDGTIDTSFGSNGSVIEQIGSNAFGADVALQSDGKIVVTGQAQVNGQGNTYAVRYNTNGSRDSSFANNGLFLNSFSSNSRANSIVIQPTDGKIILGGGDQNDTVFAIRRLNTDGTLDTSFGTNGSILTSVRSGDTNEGIDVLALTSSGKILAAGAACTSYCDWALAQYANNSPLWFTETGGNKIGRVTTAGVFSEFVVPTLNSTPADISTGSDGALWFTEINGNKIGRITTGGSFTEYSVPTSNSTPAGITAGSDGALWFTENTGNKIGRVTTGGSFTEYTVPTSNSRSLGITVGSDGALWFTEGGSNKIGRITTGGSFTEYSVPTSNSTPTGIISGSDGALWFTENTGNKIGRVTTGGSFTEYSVPTSNSRSFGISTGSDGALWFTENHGNKVGRVTTSGSFTEYSVPTSNSGSLGITAGLDGALWFTENNSNKVGRVTTTGSFTEFVVPTSNSMPGGITTGQ